MAPCFFLNDTLCFFLDYLGFRCPQNPDARFFGPSEYTYFRSNDDCSKYFLCIEGKPRAYECGEDLAFDSELNQCLPAENVTCGAVPYYGRDYEANPIVLNEKATQRPFAGGQAPRRG